MSWLDSTLGNRVRHEEEIESTVDDFCLFDESMVNIGTLGRVENLSLVASSGLLKESLSNALIDDGECDLRKGFSLCFGVILVGEDLLELIKLILDDLLSH
jgi:hypothetical protein